MWAGALNVVQGCVPDPEGDVGGFISVLERAPGGPGRGTASAKAWKGEQLRGEGRPGRRW